MNYKMIFNTIGKALMLAGALLLLPAIVALGYGEFWCCLSFVITAAIAEGLGVSAFFPTRKHNADIFAKEGFVVVALVWIAISMISALPFVIEGSIPFYVDAVFETVSGFTTTGASILEGATIEAMPHGLLFWRNFIQWLGGMGILVFVVAFTSHSSDRSIHVLKAEMPGPTVDKLVPKARNTAMILYAIYVGMTAALFLLLWIGGLVAPEGGMNAFESIVHAFGTASTGGFGTRGSGLADFNAYTQCVIGVFMLLFGVNFNLYFLMILGKVGNALKSHELWTYLAIVVLSVVSISISLIGTFETVGEIVLQSFFQVASIITTTGYATADFNQWPVFSKTLLLILMLIGGSAGSTAGGFKVSRVMILFKKVVHDLKQALHPHSANAVKFEGKKLTEDVMNGAGTYLAMCVTILVVGFLFLSFDGGVDPATAIETNVSAIISCFNNIGPGLAQVGPAANYAAYSPLSKIVLTFSMLFGRLEIYPLLLLFFPTTWKN